MAYTKVNWTSSTPINTTNLNKMDNAIEQHFNDVDESFDNANTNIENISNKIGNLENLNTTEKANLVGAINEVNTNLSGKILWTNSNTRVHFAAQKITLNSSDYDMYEIIFVNNETEDYYYNTGKIPKGHGCRLVECYGGGGGSNVRSRIIDYSNDTQLNVQVGKYAYASTGAVDSNGSCIPVYVIGYKTGLFS